MDPTVPAANARAHDLPELSEPHRRRRALLLDVRRARAASRRRRQLQRARAGEREPQRADQRRRHDGADRRRARPRGRHRARTAHDDLFRAPHPAVEAAADTARVHGLAECRKALLRGLADLHLDRARSGQRRDVARGAGPDRRAEITSRPGGRRARAPVPDGDEHGRVRLLLAAGTRERLLLPQRACSSTASPRATKMVCCCCTATATCSKNSSRPANRSTSSPARGCGKTRACGWIPCRCCSRAAAAV